MVLRVRHGGFERRKALGIEPRDKEAAVLFREAGAYRRNLLRALAQAKDHLRQSVTQGAVMVYLGEANVFVRQAPEVFERRLRTQPAGSDGVEQGAEFFVNRKASN